ncbi:MAG TPA: hypothetical protein VFB45_13380 [Pseudolabrys sp.]|nr:hypothetical protein [Pseudolabrys sp.]
MPRTRRLLAIVLIYAMAFHGVLTAFAPAALAAPFDPLAVTCLHDGASTDEGLPSGTSSACEHCILCAANAAPVMTAQVIGVLVRHATQAGPQLPDRAAPPHPALAFDQRTLRGPPLA